MANTTVDVKSRPVYVQDRTSLERTGGRTIDWENVPAGYAGADGVKYIPAGTVYSEQPNGTIIPRNGSTAAKGIILEGHREDSKVAAQGVGTIVGGVLFEELMPDFNDVAWSTYKSELTSAGCTFKFVPFNNSNSTPSYEGEDEAGTGTGTGTGTG